MNTHRSVIVGCDDLDHLTFVCLVYADGVRSSHKLWWEPVPVDTDRHFGGDGRLLEFSAPVPSSNTKLQPQNNNNEMQNNNDTISFI